MTRFLLVAALLFALSADAFAVDPESVFFCELLLSGKRISKDISLDDGKFSVDLDDGQEKLEVTFTWDGAYNVRILRLGKEVFGLIAEDTIRSLRFPGRNLKLDVTRKPKLVEAKAPRASTPAQISGPFYPGYKQFADMSNDLTNGMQAIGETVVLEGRLLDNEGNPIEGAEVHLWQTDGLAGKYRHPGDPEQHLVDPKFNSWGGTVTQKDGSYRFRTVRPIAYPAGENWMRPDHFHFAVYVNKRPVLVTQAYFRDDRWLGQDKIFQSLSETQKQSVLIGLEKKNIGWSDAEGAKTVLHGTFDIVVSRE